MSSDWSYRGVQHSTGECKILKGSDVIWLVVIDPTGESCIQKGSEIILKESDPKRECNFLQGAM